MPRRQDPETVRLESGISVYVTVEQASRTARRFPAIGRYIAEIDIPDAGPIAFERTLTAPGHHTIWGMPRDILEAVRRTFEVI